MHWNKRTLLQNSGRSFRPPIGQTVEEAIGRKIAVFPLSAHDLLAWFRLLVLASCLFALALLADADAVSAAGMEGSGTSDDPYVILTPEQLDSVRHDMDAHYRLGADIDMSAFGVFHPIGHVKYTPNETRPEFLDMIVVPFTGYFDGGHHVISNLKIRAPEPAVPREYYEGIGLFGYVQGTGKDTVHIQKVRLESVDTDSIHRTGSLAGELHDAGVSQISAKDIEIYGAGYVGGLIGYAENARIESSYTHAGFGAYGSTNVGGLLGYGKEIEIANSFAAVDTVATNANGGGLAGYLAGTGTAIRNSYSVGQVTGPERLGRPPVSSVGGLIGKIVESPHLSHVYWDTDASNQADSAGAPAAVGLTTSEMQAVLDGFDENAWLFMDGMYPQLRDFWADALEALEPHAGELAPAFHPAVEDYELTFSESASFLQVTPSSLSDEAQIRVNGVLVASGSESPPVLLDEGKNEDAVRIEVTGPHGHVKTYRISVTTPVEPHVPGPQPAPGPGPPAGDPVKQPAVWTYSGQWNVQDNSAVDIFFPNLLAADSSGFLYTASATHIQKWTGDGELIREWGGLDGIYGLAVKETEDGVFLYVAEAPYLRNRIQNFTDDGVFVSSSGPLYTDPEDTGTLIEARGMAFNSQGLLYVADAGNHQVHILNEEWEIVKSWGSEGGGLGQFRTPLGLAIDSYNHVYVSEMGNHRIQKFDYKGENPQQWGGYGKGDSQFDRPKELALDPADYVYVADAYNHQIKRFDPEGQFLQKWGAVEGHQSAADGKFHTPGAVVVDGDWNLYVADTFNHRIQKFTPVFNDPPTDIALSPADIKEEQPIGTLVGTLEATDPDEEETFAYSLVEGEGADDNDRFAIEGNSLLSAAVFDYFDQREFSIRVRVTDTVGQIFEKVLTVTVNEVNEPPTTIQLSGGYIDELQAPGAVVGTLSAVDADEHDTHIYELVEGEGAEDNGSFTIVGNELRAAETFNYYEKTTYSIRVRATDSFGQTAEVHYVIGVRHVNQAPTEIRVSDTIIRKGSPAGTEVAELDAEDRDRDETFTFALVTDPGAPHSHLFRVDGNRLVTNAEGSELEVASQEFGGFLFIALSVTDSGGLSVQQYVLLSLADSLTGLSLSNSSMPERQPAGTVVGTFEAANPVPGQPVQFALAEGEGAKDNAKFSIDGDKLVTASILDYYAQEVYQIRVRASDAFGNSVEQAFAITITYENQPPTAVTLSSSQLDEGQPAGSIVGTLEAADRDSGETFAFSLVAGEGDTNNGDFTLDGSTLRTNRSFDYYVQNELSIRVQARDSANHAIEEVLVIQIRHVNQPPTGIHLSHDAIAEGAPVGTVIGTLHAADRDHNETFIFSLAAGEGDADNGSFVLDGNVLKAKQMFRYDEQSVYSIRVRVADAANQAYEQALTIRITQVEPPGKPVLQSMIAGDESVVLTWHPVEGADSYHVFQSTESGSYGAESATVTGDVYRYQAVGLTNGTSYYFVVRASNAGGFGPASEEGSATPQMQAPGAPAWRDATPGDESVTLRWHPAEGAAGYQLFHSPVAGTYGTEAISVTSDVYEYRVTGLTNGMTYYFVMKAHNPGGLSPASPEISAAPLGVPAAPTEVRAEAGHGQAVVHFRTPADNGGRDITGYKVTVMPGERTITGTSSPITVPGLSNGTAYTFTVQAMNVVGESVPSPPSNAVTPRSSGKPSNGEDSDEAASEDGENGSGLEQASSLDVLVNGQPFRAGILTTALNDQQSVALVAVDGGKLLERLSEEGIGAQITIPVQLPHDVVIGELNGELIRRMEQQQAIVEIRTREAAYTLPAREIQIEAIAEQLGQGVALQDITIRIQMAVLSEREAEAVDRIAVNRSFTLAAPPIRFTVEAVHEDSRMEVTTFSRYVERAIAIPEGTDPGRLTTGIAIDPDRTVRHIPTRVSVREGRYYAQLNSLTNSTYAIIWHPVAFDDMRGHWAQQAVNDMGGRLVVSGFGDNRFRPNQAVTRAEFAAMLVNGLGLRPESGASGFTDVHAEDWHHDALLTAYAHNLITGYEESAFRPDDRITREQAVTMIARAMNITGLKGNLPAEASTNSLLRTYADADQVAGWAKAGMADSLQAGVITGRSGTELAPKSLITRAEAAVLIQRLLRKSNLI